jgi:hypothetical protein
MTIAGHAEPIAKAHRHAWPRLRDRPRGWGDMPVSDPVNTPAFAERIEECG